MTSSTSRGLSRAVALFEQVIVFALAVMMMVVIVLSTFDLGSIIVEDILTPPVVLLGVDELFEIFGFFLLILIGVELLETIKAYLQTRSVHLELVLEVALVAIARKIIVLDMTAYGGLSVIGIAVLVAALAAADYLSRRARAHAGRASAE